MCVHVLYSYCYTDNDTYVYMQEVNYLSDISSMQVQCTNYVCRMYHVVWADTHVGCKCITTSCLVSPQLCYSVSACTAG